MADTHQDSQEVSQPAGDGAGDNESKLSPGEPMKLFIGQVPNHFNEDDIRKVFEPYGAIVEVSILRDRSTGASQGCAFVTFSSRAHAERAIEALNDKVSLHPTKRNLVVAPAGTKQSTADWKLFVGMLARTSTEDRVVEIFSPYGTVKEVHLLRDANGNSKGCGFVKFADQESANNAIRALNDVFQDDGAPRPLTVRFAERRGPAQGPPPPRMPAAMQGPPMHQNYGPPMGAYPPQQQSWDPNYGMYYGGPPPQQMQYQPYPQQYGYAPQQPMYQQQPPPSMHSPAGRYGGSAMGGDGDRGPPGANLFVFNIPDSFADGDLAGLFSGFGTLMSAKVFIDKATGRGKGFGFVSFSTPAEAESAIAGMNGREVMGRVLKVSHKKASAADSGRQQSYAPY